MSARLGLISSSLLLSAAVVLAATSGAAAPANSPDRPLGSAPRTVEAPTEEAGTPAEALYHDAGLAGIVDRDVVEAAYESLAAHGLERTSGTLAIADMSQPSTAQRLVLVDLKTHALLLRTWVAHGQGSGGLLRRALQQPEGIARHEPRAVSRGCSRS